MSTDKKDLLEVLDFVNEENGRGHSNDEISDRVEKLEKHLRAGGNTNKKVALTWVALALELNSEGFSNDHWTEFLTELETRWALKKA